MKNTHARRMRSVKALLSRGQCCSLVAGSALALANVSVSAQESAGLEEITVTARRVTENLQDVPAAISAMSGAFIDQQRIRDVAQVLELTPGATFTSLHKGQQDFSLRGISSQTVGAAGDSAVATYVDNIVIGKDFAKSVEFFDVDRVEILRGPQGTTFGRNASAGLVHIFNKRPSRDFSAYVEGTVGDYNLYEINSVVNGAISDTVSGRLGVHYDDRNGYTTDISDGRHLDGVQNTSVRGQLLVEPSDSVSVWLKAEWSKDDDDSPIRKGPDCTRPYLEPPFGNYTEPCDPWKTDIASEKFTLKRDIVSTAAEVIWNVSSALRLTSETGYINARMDRSQNLFGTPFDVLLQFSADDAWQFSQEFRLDNSAADAALDWLAGVYFYTDNHAKDGENREALTYLGPPFATRSTLRSNNKTTSYGVFGQVGYDLTDHWNATVSARYTFDKKNFRVFHSAQGGLADVFVDPAEDPVEASASADWNKVTGAASLSYAVSNSAKLYGLVSRGYKSGGFGGEPSTLVAAVTPYNEETAMNYEIGAKTEWLDNRLRINTDVFYMDYADLQVDNFLPSGAPFIQNAGGTKVIGVELETAFAVNDYLTLMAGYARLDGKLKGEVGGVSVEGNRPGNSPKWTASFAAQVDVPLPNGSSLGLRADYHGRSDVFDGPFQEAELIRPGVNIVGARIEWASASKRWNAAVWGKNLTDEAEIISRGPIVLVSQSPTGYGAPRTYGLTIRRSF
jgi:iron complex outermembrane receptor protein